MGLLDDGVQRRCVRTEPVGRLSWPVRLLGLLLTALTQVVLGSGASRGLGSVLLALVVPPQAVGTWAASTLSREG